MKKEHKITSFFTSSDETARAIDQHNPCAGRSYEIKKEVILRSFLAFIFLFISCSSIAEVPVWKIVPKDSSITFTATQNDAPISGEFKSFTGDIQFSPNQLDASHVNVEVDLASVSTSYQTVADTLKTAPWFDVKLFPKAIFKATDFKKMEGNTYQANGTLTIRDKTLPVTLTFSLDEFSKTKAHAKGSITLKRTAFGIGSGKWKDTKEVKDDVLVNFIITAINQ